MSLVVEFGELYFPSNKDYEEELDGILKDDNTGTDSYRFIEKIKQVGCGANYCIFLSEFGNLYFRGSIEDSNLKRSPKIIGSNIKQVLFFF